LISVDHMYIYIAIDLIYFYIMNLNYKFDKCYIVTLMYIYYILYI